MYLEYYIIENLLINYIIISCTTILTKKYNSSIKKWIGAFIGALYSVAYVYPSLEILFTFPFKVLIMTFITLISFTYKNIKEYFRMVLVFYMVNVFISGSTYFIIYFTGISHIKISFIIICAYISCELLKYIYRDIKTLKYIKETTKDIKINILNKTCICKALIDSGNLLNDPIGNNDVIIVKASKLKGIIPDILVNYDYDNMDMNKIEKLISYLDYDIYSRVRMIPYKHAASKDSNMILGLKVDYVEIDNSKVSSIVIGISNFDDKEYSAILSPRVLESI